MCRAICASNNFEQLFLKIFFLIDETIKRINPNVNSKFIFVSFSYYDRSSKKKSSGPISREIISRLKWNWNVPSKTPLHAATYSQFCNYVIANDQVMYLIPYTFYVPHTFSTNALPSPRKSILSRGGRGWRGAQHRRMPCLDTSVLGKFCREHARRLQISRCGHRPCHHFRRRPAGWSAF